MGIGQVLIYRICVNGEIGCYEISSNHFDMNNFYMCIDKSTKIIKLFATKNFNEKPMLIIDFNKDEERKCVGVPARVLGIVLYQVSKALRMDNFPESLSFAA